MNKPMNKSEMINAIAEAASISKVSASQALEGMMSAITSSLQGDKPVTLVGFGTFYVKDRAARTGRNPKTGEPIKIAAARVPGFRAGKLLRDAIRGVPDAPKQDA